MFTIRAEQLETLVGQIFVAAGSPEDVASYVAHSLVTNNLMGHDSHGVIRVPRYAEWVRSGRIKPSVKPEIVKETDTTALVSGNWTFGQVATRFAAEVAIQKAKRANVGAVGVARLNHNGRLGEFVEMMAKEGLFGMAVLGGNREFASVAPYGGKARIFGTNPYAFALPAGRRPMVVVDFATSVTAEGKLQVARAKGQPVAPGAILDKDGRSTTNVHDFYNGGMLLPVGNHKGYGLMLIAELLCAPFIGSSLDGERHRVVGALLLALNVEAFRPLADFTREADALIDQIKAVPPAEGFDEVLVPGEPEQRSMALRKQNGIPLPEDTWQQLVKTAQDLGVEVKAEAKA